MSKQDAISKIESLETAKKTAIWLPIILIASFGLAIIIGRDNESFRFLAVLIIDVCLLTLAFLPTVIERSIARLEHQWIEPGLVNIKLGTRCTFHHLEGVWKLYNISHSPSGRTKYHFNNALLDTVVMTAIPVWENIRVI